MGGFAPEVTSAAGGFQPRMTVVLSTGAPLRMTAESSILWIRGYPGQRLCTAAQFGSCTAQER